MSNLYNKLKMIQKDKNDNLLPENLKKGVTLLGVQGTLEPSLKTGVKLFKTQEEMQADTTAKEGDLATVYRSDIKSISNGDTITSITFPKTVVFDTTITSSYNGRLRNSSEPRIYLNIQLDASRFSLFDMNGTIREIEYSSTDGITYTRTDSNEDTYEIGETTVEGLDEHICKFIQVGVNVFEGLFEYSSYKDKTKIKLPLMSGLNIQYNSSSSTISSVTFNKEFSDEINFTKLVSVYNKFISDTSTPSKAFIYLDNNNNLKFVQNCNMLCYDKNVNFLGASVTVSTETDVTAKIYSIDLENETYTLDTELEPSGYVYNNSSYNWNYYNLDNKTIPFNIINSKPTNFSNICIGDTTSSKTSYTKYIEENDCYVDTSSYLTAPTQLTTATDEVYKSVFYGKNGVETGTLTEKVSNLFTDLNAKIYSEIQNAYDNMKPRILTDTDNDIDNNILLVPVKSDGTPLLDTSNMTNMRNLFAYHQKLIYVSSLNTSSVVNMSEMFSNCSSLKIVGLLDTSKVTMMYNMFDSCRNLISIPLLDTSKATEMNNMFNHCTSLSKIPQLDISKATSIAGMFGYCSSLKEIPQLDTSNATNAGAMFRNCTALETVPLMNISKVTNLVSMFEGCTSLSDESLNNILGMCISATSYTDTKTLKYIGLTEDQANKCKTLSNYSAFTSAGWTTGY